MKRLYTTLLLLIIVLAACAAQPEPTPTPQPTPLPTAVPPQNPPASEDASWMVSFTHEFGPGFWEQGFHKYGFLIDCSITDLEQFSSEWIPFQVYQKAPKAENVMIYLRIGGLTTDYLGGNAEPDLTFHPDMPTTAVVHYAGLTEEVAKEITAQCEGLVSWDGNNFAPLIPSEPFQP
jgi:hypothetical protein